MPHPSQRNTVAMILAGGAGSRLATLSEVRAKPAVPFAGQYRLIDFTLSNAMHSGLPYVGILTQYRPYSLMSHLSLAEWWGYHARGRMAAVLPPYQGQTDASWYAGTADAIYQNLSFVNRFEPEAVVVLSGDHVYRMDYAELISFHLERGADLTIACQRVPWEETRRFGVMRIDEAHRIVEFQEKPQRDPVSNLASLGIYVFDPKALNARLREDAAQEGSSHDFGNDIIPRMIRESPVFCYEFDGYWRDVGTLQSYWQANLDALNPECGLDLARWDVRTNTQPSLTVNHRPARFAGAGSARSSIISKGCLIEGEVENSVISPGVHIRKGARVTGSIILDGCVVGEGARVDRAIVDKLVVVGRDAQIGCGEPAPNTRNPDLLADGLTLVGRETRLPDGQRIGRHCLIQSHLSESAFPVRDIPSGACV